MKNPFENIFGSNQKKAKKEEKSKADRLNDLRAQRKNLVDAMSSYSHPDDSRVLEDINRSIVELEK